MPRPNQEDRLCDIIGDILSLSPDCHKATSAAMKTLTESHQDHELLHPKLLTFPQIWVESVCDESSEDEDDKTSPRRHNVTSCDVGITSSRYMSFSSTDVSFESASLTPCSTRQNSLQYSSSRENSVECSSETTDEEIERRFTEVIGGWLEKINARGFPVDVLRGFVEKNDEPEEDEATEEAEDDDTWWEEGVVRVFDPYFDVALDEVETVEGKKNVEGKPVGPCNIILKNGDSVFGTFRKGLRQGRGAIEGSNCFKYGLVGLRGYYKDGILTGEGRAILAPGAWAGVGRLTLEGVFSNGYLEGPVRGIDDRGNLIFIGSFSEGIASGPCWLAREGQGWLHGVVDAKGRFSGDEILFLYPDFQNCIVGTYKNERLVSGIASKIVGVGLNENSVLVLSPARPKPGAPILDYCPSNKDSIPCDWNLGDTYENSTVVCKPSSVNGAGDGLFAAKDLPTNTIVSYYNGLHIEPGEIYNTNSFSYQIYVDWKNTDGSPFVDIPPECTDITNYSASLGHKANHSFVPNCQFVAVEHPRFGRIPALKTIKAVKKGDELFSHYKYDMALAPSWYQEAWNRLYDPANVSTGEEFDVLPPTTDDCEKKD